MRLYWVTISLLLALAFGFVCVTATEVYDGPDTIEGDITWTDESFVLEGPVYVNETASLTLVNTTLVPAVNFTGTAMIVGYGPINVTGSTLEGGRWWTIIYSSADVTVVDSTFSNSSYAVLTIGNLTVTGSEFSDNEYGIRSGGALMSVSGTTFESCAVAFNSYSGRTEMTDVSFFNTTYFVGWIYSDTAELSGITIGTAGEGISTWGTDIEVQLDASDVREENCDAGCSGPSVTGSVFVAEHGNVTVRDSSISDSDGAFIGYYTTLNADNVTFDGLDGGLYGYHLEANVTNSTFIDCGVGLEASRSNATFVGCDFINTTVEARQWWIVRILVEDPYGDNVRSATVTVIDSEGEVKEGTTNVIGRVEFGIVAYVQTNGTIETFGPYNITVEKDGFETSMTGVELEDEIVVDIELPYLKPDINVTDITTTGRGIVTIRATITNTGDHVAENVTVGFTYKAGFIVRVIGTVELGDVAIDGVETAEMEWDARDLIGDGDTEFEITVNAEARNDEPSGSMGDNHGSISLDVGDIGEEDEEPNLALVAIIIVMLVLIAFLVIKFVTRESPEEDPGIPGSWDEVRKSVRKKVAPPRTNRGKTPAPKGRAPGRRQPPAK